MIQHGPWQIVASREIHRDPWTTLRLDQVIRPDGLPGTYSVLQVKAGVCVIALDDQQQLHLTEEFHYAVGRVTIEGVSGGIDAEESPQAAARRELLEELGIAAREWTDLGECDPFTASVGSPTRLFLARDLEFRKARPEGTELIRPVIRDLSQAIDDVMQCRITHAPTCLAILKTHLLLKGNA